ncbi:hypothetical protein M406DRAFT_356355 [Cryphonectria parasitica EP155]|uniref:Uncharacterized protein n=1 Tax=Cryphonectria parasitica (strain ATCC 38755 / EP155) TaxID=660469 RepID=A0A9P4Y4Q0_CRYP1|nr:uncharacterized protein M406DRAFT_356355 [Cryphonectria parasitica EP155]KAF3766481.1 hypothetical protein M406DRAFT_356355 [Cryphonectria parasitica EP155]
MDWLSRSNQFETGDKTDIGFHPEQPCRIRIIEIQEDNDGNVDINPSTIESQDGYVAWAQQIGPSLRMEHRPTFCLVMHQRLRGPHDTLKATALPYDDQTFTKVCTELCQHRSLAGVIARDSTAVLNIRHVNWDFGASSCPSVVYHCKSDTESLPRDEDIVLSATCFTNKPVILAVAYGCTDDVLEDIEAWLERIKTSVFHRLVLPMLFAELERKRLLDAMEYKSTDLDQKILDLKNQLKNERTVSRSLLARNNEKRTEIKLTERDAEAVELWRSISQLKNGIQTLLALLESMNSHLKDSSKMRSNNDPHGAEVYPHEKESEMHIESRLDEMIAEINSKLRHCQGLLDGMALAMQMERDYYTRQDSRASYSLARASSRDGSTMKIISRLGMYFLPPTFLAGLFSMSFFNWIPSNSQIIVSPWIALYAGLAALFTIFTWVYSKRMDIVAEIENEKTLRDVDSDGGEIV